MGKRIVFTRAQWELIQTALVDNISYLKKIRITEQGDKAQIGGLHWRASDSTLEADVDDFTVELEFKKSHDLNSSCTCSQEGYCRHRVLLLVYLMKHNHNLSEMDFEPNESNSRGALSQLVAEKVEAKVSHLARKFLRVADRWFEEKASVINSGELSKLCGRAVFWGYNDKDIPLFPKAHPPATAMEYLICLAIIAKQMDINLPAPIPDVLDKARMAEIEFKREEEKQVNLWRSTLSKWKSDNNSHAYPEVRLRLFQEFVMVESRAKPTDEFVEAKQSKMAALFRSRSNNETGRPPAGHELVFRAMTDAYGNFRTTDIVPHSPALVASLSGLFAFPELFSRYVVGKNGEPLTLVKEPLRWRLKEPTDSAFYKILLVDAQEKPVPFSVAILPGSTKYYVTSFAVYPLEHWPKGLDKSSISMRIPVRALESNSGLEALRLLDLPIPPKLSARIQILKPSVTVQAKMTVPYNSKSDYLQMVVRGTYGTKHVPDVRWSGESWLKDSERERRKADENEEVLLQLDNALLDEVEIWLRELTLKKAYDFWSSGIIEQRIRGKDWANDFTDWLERRPEGCKVELQGELASLANGKVAGTVRLDIEESPHGIDWFDLHVGLEVVDTELTQEEINLLLKAQGRWVRLQGKGWRKLELEISDEQRAELAALGLAAHDFSEEKQRLHALQLGAAAKNGGNLLGAERVAQVRRRIAEIQTRVTPPIPPAITAHMRPYQVEGFHFLSYLTENNFGGVLADDMGLGKTLQALTWIAWLREQKELAEPVLVICPKSVQDNWRSECVKFFPKLKVEVWTRETAGKAGHDGTADLLVIHYAQLRSQEELLASRRWGAVILDEAQAIKNPTSQSSRAARNLVAPHRLALTGTPIENRLMDLWSIFAFAMPGVLGNRTSFSKHFDRQNDPLARRRLAARTRPFLLRRTKKEVEKDLPERIEEDLMIEFDGVQAALYQAELKRARAMLLNVATNRQLDKLRFNILTSLLRLRQICCHPQLIGYSEKSKTKKPKTPRKEGASLKEGTSAKVSALLETLEPLMEDGHKVLVFSQFVGMLEIIEKEIKARKWTQFKLTGETEDRGPLVDSFQKHKGEAVFLISLKAGGSGLNLTAASYVILFDPWWNPAVEAQAIDRTHRIGQKNTVFAYRLLIKGTIEEKIRLLQRKKGALAQDILGEESFAKALSLDDFRFLLGDEEEIENPKEQVRS